MTKLILIALILSVAPAYAMRVAVLPFDGEEPLSESLTDVFVQTLSSDDFEVELADLPLSEVLSSFGCSEQNLVCMSQAGAMFSTDWLVWGHVTSDEDNLKLRVSVLDTAVSLILYSVNIDAPVDLLETNNVHPEERLKKDLKDYTTAKIMGVVSEVPIEVKTVPSGAMLSIDGVIVGKSPYSGFSTPGSHTITVLKNGFNTVNKRFELEDRKAIISLQLERTSQTGQVSQATESKPSREARTASSARSMAPQSTTSKPWNFYAGIGTGVLTAGFLGWSIYNTLDAQKLRDNAESEKDYQAFLRKNKDYEDARSRSYLTWGLTGAFAASTLYLFFFHDKLFSEKTSTAFVPTSNGFSFFGRW